MPHVVHKFKLLGGRIVGVRLSEDTENTREMLSA